MEKEKLETKKKYYKKNNDNKNKTKYSNQKKSNYKNIVTTNKLNDDKSINKKEINVVEEKEFDVVKDNVIEKVNQKNIEIETPIEIDRDEPKKVGKKKYILIPLLIILILGLVYLIYNLIPRFYIKNFESERMILYSSNETFSEEYGEVCYGNFISCKKVKVTNKSNVDLTKLGEYEVSYTYSYGKKKITQKQKLEVVDKEKPVIEISGDEVYYCPNKKIDDSIFKASDNYDGDLTSSVTKELFNDEFIFRVQDSSGNVTEVIKKAVLKDLEKPKITLNGSSVVYVALNQKYSESGAKASDNCDGDITSKITVSGSVNTKKVGNYTITYSVKDELGNKSSVTRKVYVYQRNNSSTPGGNSIYLTFDDGPGPYTNKLLDILKKYDVKATFFVTDQGLTRQYGSAIKRAYNEGHSIGLHTSSHNYKYIYANETNYFKDLEAINKKVVNLTGYTSKILRFPGGSSNTVSRQYDGGKRIMSRLTKAVEAKGYSYFDWNISSGDAGGATSRQAVVNNVTKALKGGRTYVVFQR